MINVEVFLPGLLILLQHFSPKPELQYKYNGFLSCWLAITRHNPEAPSWMQLAGQTGVPTFSSRSQLITWFCNLAGIDRWAGAEQLVKKPKLWGRYVWSLIHGLALLVRDESDRRFYVQWVRTLPSVLPCVVCSSSFSLVVRNIPSRQIESNVYAMRLHEAVNKKLGSACSLYYPSGSDSWRTALDDQHLLNYTPLAEIPLPVEEEQPHPHQHSAPAIRPRPAPPVFVTNHHHHVDNTHTPPVHKKPRKRLMNNLEHRHVHPNCNCSR